MQGFCKKHKRSKIIGRRKGSVPLCKTDDRSAEKIEERFETGKEESKHLITIAASTIPAQYILPKILMKFNERYPKEQVKLLETDSSQVVTKIIDHMVDAWIYRNGSGEETL